MCYTIKVRSFIFKYHTTPKTRKIFLKTGIPKVGHTIKKVSEDKV